MSRDDSLRFQVSFQDPEFEYVPRNIVARLVYGCFCQGPAVGEGLLGVRFCKSRRGRVWPRVPSRLATILGCDEFSKTPAVVHRRTPYRKENNKAIFANNVANRIANPVFRAAAPREGKGVKMMRNSVRCMFVEEVIS